MRAILVVIVAGALIGGGGVFAWHYYGGFSAEKRESIAFIDAYGAYAEVADRVDQLVHLPGTEGNTDRAELLTLLNSILTDSIDAGHREELARLAFNNLITLKKEIDEAHSAQARVYEELQNVERASKVFASMARRQSAGAVVMRARERAELTARITSVLSEGNDQTYAILSRILEEKGELSQEHIAVINGSTTVAQNRFDTLSALYADLVEKKKALDADFKKFVHDAL